MKEKIYFNFPNQIEGTMIEEKELKRMKEFYSLNMRSLGILDQNLFNFYRKIPILNNILSKNIYLCSK
jgi:hypothetical protein